MTDSERKINNMLLHNTSCVSNIFTNKSSCKDMYSDLNLRFFPPTFFSPNICLSCSLSAKSTGYKNLASICLECGWTDKLCHEKEYAIYSIWFAHSSLVELCVNSALCGNGESMFSKVKMRMEIEKVRIYIWKLFLMWHLMIKKSAWAFVAVCVHLSEICITDHVFVFIIKGTIC